MTKNQRVADKLNLRAKQLIDAAVQRPMGDLTRHDMTVQASTLIEVAAAVLEVEVEDAGILPLRSVLGVAAE
jgi:hypothetical protein